MQTGRIIRPDLYPSRWHPYTSWCLQSISLVPRGKLSFSIYPVSLPGDSLLTYPHVSLCASTHYQLPANPYCHVAKPFA